LFDTRLEILGQNGACLTDALHRERIDHLAAARHSEKSGLRFLPTVSFGLRFSRSAISQLDQSLKLAGSSG
jgi:hypothetical protein